MQIKDKVVVITGGGRGLGRAMALGFAERGGHIALLDLDQADLDETRRLVEARGVRAVTCIANVAREEEIVAALDGVVRDLGGLDVMINNAGVMRDGLLVKVKDGEVASTMTLARWSEVIDVNLTGVFLCGREAAVRMIRLGRGGVIINISSVSRHGNFGQTNYSAAKAGVSAMTVVWAKELARYGIRSAAIAPGFCATEILASMSPEMLAKVTAPVPVGRLGEPAEVAHSAIYIVENDFYNGRILDLDGGLRI